MASKPKGKDGEAPEEPSDTEDPVQERKLYLQEESRTLTQHLGTYLGRAERLLRANKRLQEEARSTQEQSQTQLSCGARLGQDPPGMIITLNEQNRGELARARLQREELSGRYAGREQQVRSALQDTEERSSLLDAQLRQLQPLEQQKERAEQKAKALEKELRVTRIRCAEESQASRSGFLQQKAASERRLQHRMRELTWAAQEAALRALVLHLRQVRAENRLLRHELLGLLRHCRLLRRAGSRLREQREQLLREERCARRAALPAPARAQGHRARARDTQSCPRDTVPSPRDTQSCPRDTQPCCPGRTGN